MACVLDLGVRDVKTGGGPASLSINLLDAELGSDGFLLQCAFYYLISLPLLFYVNSPPS